MTSAEWADKCLENADDSNRLRRYYMNRARQAEGAIRVQHIDHARYWHGSHKHWVALSKQFASYIADAVVSP